MNKRRGAHEIGALDEFEAAVLEFEAGGVEGTGVVGDQDDALKAVDIDEELELIDDALLFEVGLRVTGEAGGAAGEGDSVVPRQVQAILKEIVEMLADAAVGAVDGRGTDSGALVGEAGFVG